MATASWHEGIQAEGSLVKHPCGVRFLRNPPISRVTLCPMSHHIAITADSAIGALAALAAFSDTQKRLRPQNMSPGITGGDPSEYGYPRGKATYRDRHGVTTTEDEWERDNRRTGRNEPCWCGSGRKYKVCCLRDDEEIAALNRR